MPSIAAAASSGADDDDGRGRDRRGASSSLSGGGSGSGSSVLETLPSPSPSPTPTPTADDDRIPGRCDICNRPDGRAAAADGKKKSKSKAKARPNNMQKCRRCGLTVHELCNGMVPTTTKDPHWICAACSSVGTTSPVGLRQKERPTECVLCSVGGGGGGVDTRDRPPHAMHPLYDDFGKDGKQVILPASTSAGKPRRLAWVHTLCAFSVGTNAITRGSIVGCDERGGYIEDDDLDDEEGGFLDSDEGEREANLDDVGGRGGGGGGGAGGNTAGGGGGGGRARRGNGVDGTSADGDGNDDSDANDDSEDDDGGDDGSRQANNKNQKELTFIHHFVIVSDEEPWKSRIKDCRKTTCFLCRRKDDDPGKPSLRIPVQCAAGDTEQIRRHRRFFPPDQEGCTVAMHVGCARWMMSKGKGTTGVGDGIRRWRVMYSPGQVSTTTDAGEDEGGGGGGDAYAECYCNDHARTVAMFKGGLERSSSDGGSTTKSGSTMRSGQPQAPSRRTSSSSSSAAAAAGTGKRSAERHDDHRSTSSGSKRARKDWDEPRGSVVGPDRAGDDGDGTVAEAAASSSSQAQSKKRRASAPAAPAPSPAPTVSQAQSKKRRASVPAHSPALGASYDAASDERARRRASLEDAIASRTLRPPGRSRDYLDGRYEWRLRRGMEGAGARGGAGARMPPDEETPWTGTSPLERAMVGCCVSSGDDGGGDGGDSPRSTVGGAIHPGKEGQFLALAAVHCRTLWDRSLALAIMDRSNVASGENEERRRVMANFLSLGGMKLLTEWLDDASTPKHPDGSEPHHASDTGPLLLPILQVLERIPFDIDLVKKLDLNVKLRALSKRLKHVAKKNKKVRCHPAAGGLDVSAVRSALDRLMASWREKAKEPPTRGRDEREVFSDLFARMKSQYALLAEYEAKDETAPWIKRIIAAKKRAPVNEKMRQNMLKQAEEKKKIERMRESRRREAEAKQAQVKQFMQPIRADVQDKEAKLQAELRRSQAELMEAKQRREDHQKSMDENKQKRNSSMVEKLKDGKTRKGRVRWADEEEGQPLEEVKSIKGRSPADRDRGPGEAEGETDRGPDIDGIRRSRITRNKTADRRTSQTKETEADASNESADSLDGNHEGETTATVEDGLASGSDETGANVQTKKAEGAAVGEATMFDI